MAVTGLEVAPNDEYFTVTTSSSDVIVYRTSKVGYFEVKSEVSSIFAPFQVISSTRCSDGYHKSIASIIKLPHTLLLHGNESYNTDHGLENEEEDEDDEEDEEEDEDEDEEEDDDDNDDDDGAVEASGCLLYTSDAADE